MPPESATAAVHAYGYWPSPLAAATVARGRISRSDLQSDGVALYWLESRPTEGGRVVFVRMTAGVMSDHSPAGVSIRSRVHEYGGGAVCLLPGHGHGHGDGAFAYVDQRDQVVRFCHGPGDATPRAVSAAAPDGTTWHHGGLTASPDGAWVLAVREEHHADQHLDEPARTPVPRRSIVALAVDAGTPAETTLLSGHDFYGAAAVHPDGDRVVATAWDHPDMPWDSSLVIVAALRTDPAATPPRLEVEGEPWVVAGGPGESVGQPAWRPDGTLRFVSDRTGWWLPYLHSGRPGPEAPRPLTDRQAEFHGPDWVLGQRTMADLPDGSLVARLTADGRDRIVRWPDPDAVAAAPRSTTAEPHEDPCLFIAGLCADGPELAVLGTTAEEPAAIWVSPARHGVRSSASASAAAETSADASTAPTTLGPEDIAHPTAFTCQGRSGRSIHATLSRPTLSGTQGPPDTEAPLIVFCHSGPTSAVRNGFDSDVQFFTTRGFAVAQVDYSGSSGYGRAYRSALDGQWGIADAQDCLDTARHLATHHPIDATRMAIRGSSAGGFTALNAMAAGEGFAACASWYGVTDLLTLAASTHDFEAHYNDRLVGPLPEAAETYRARSPLTHAPDMTGAVLLLQGADDPVVPLAQAQQLHDALRAAGRTCELRIFDGEGHGFRRADTLEAAYTAELDFYRTHLRL